MSVVKDTVRLVSNVGVHDCLLVSLRAAARRSTKE